MNSRMTVTKVGCHTIVFKDDERKDLDLMLRTVAEAGYPVSSPECCVTETGTQRRRS